VLELVRLCAAAYGVLFILAAVSKLDSWTNWSATAAALFGDRRLAQAVRFATPAIEAVVGGLALIVPGAGLVASAALLALFAATALVKARHHAGYACNCFGALMPSRVGYGLAVRNLAMLAPAVVVLVFASAADARPQPLEAPALLVLVVAVALFLVLSEYVRLNARVSAREREVQRSG
jgi:hypothetical protein